MAATVEKVAPHHAGRSVRSCPVRGGRAARARYLARMETVGVVIRTLNEAELVGTCLETLKSQRCDYELDILVVDSGSTDGTLEISRSHGARIHEISPDDFDYSKALNAGIERVGGDLV